MELMISYKEICFAGLADIIRMQSASVPWKTIPYMGEVYVARCLEKATF
jgi:hypothetical protein